MQITVTIPDEFAAQVQARGVSPEAVIEQWVADQLDGSIADPNRAQKLTQLEKFFSEMAADSQSVQLLPDAAFTRESFYRDRD